MYEAEFPLCDNEDDPKVSAVVMKYVMWPGGIMSCEPSKIKKCLESLSTSDTNTEMYLVTNHLKEK